MTPEDAEEFTQTLGQIGGGWWRQVLLGYRMGAPEALGLTLEAWSERVRGPIRLAAEERREAVKELTAPQEEGGEGLSNRKAGAILGFAESTIREDKKEELGDARNRAPDPSGLPGAEPRDARNRAPDATPSPPNGTHQPTLGESLPPDLELPPGELSPIQRGASAIGRVHVVTKFSPQEMAEAVMEMEALTDDPDYASQHLEKSRELAGWLEDMTLALNRLVAGPRLRVVAQD